MTRWLAFSLLVVLVTFPGVAQSGISQTKEKQQFAYILRLVPRLVDTKNWTEEDNKIVERHLQQLQQLRKDGKLILAGRTLVSDPTGIVILQVDTLEEARQIMQNDEAVKAKIMTAQVYPFKVSLTKASE